MTAQKTMASNLTEGNVLKQLIRFTLPIIASNLLQIVYTLVDMFVVGRFIGSAGISAVSAGGDTLALFTTFSMGLCSAGQVIISQFLGKNDKDSVKKTIGTMFSFVLALSLVLTAVSISCTKGILKLLNTPSEAWDMAIDYAIVCFSGMFFIYGYNTVSAMLRGMGDSKRPLLFIIISTVTNLILDFIFVGPCNMGTFGAALATVIGQSISFIFSVIYLYIKRESFGFDFKPKSFIPDKAILKMLLKLGIPMALQSIAVNISSMYVSSCINSYGVTASALSGIGNKLRMVIAIFSSSFGIAGSAMMAQNIGANKYDRVRKIYIIIFLVLFVLCAFIGGVGALFPKTVIGFFDKSAEILEMAPKFMIINLVTYMAFAPYQPFTCLVNGIGHASLAFIIGIIDGFVARIGLVWLLGKVLDYGIWGVWWGAALAAYVGAIIGTIYFLSGRWKTRKPITNQ